MQLAAKYLGENVFVYTGKKEYEKIIAIYFSIYVIPGRETHQADTFLYSF